MNCSGKLSSLCAFLCDPRLLSACSRGPFCPAHRGCTFFGQVSYPPLPPLYSTPAHQRACCRPGIGSLKAQKQRHLQQERKPTIPWPFEVLAYKPRRLASNRHHYPVNHCQLVSTKPCMRVSLMLCCNCCARPFPHTLEGLVLKPPGDMQGRVCTYQSVHTRTQCTHENDQKTVLLNSLSVPLFCLEYSTLKS